LKISKVSTYVSVIFLADLFRSVLEHDGCALYPWRYGERIADIYDDLYGAIENVEEQDPFVRLVI